MATLTLALDMRRAKKDGAFPLVFKLSVNREKSYITTGISVKPIEFHTESNQIIGNPKANELLMNLDTQYRTRFYQYIINNQGHEQLSEAKAFILNRQPEEFTVAEYWDNLINNMKVAGRDGGVKIYQQSLSTISKEINLDIPFTALSYKDVMNLETKLYKRGMSINGASVYLRTFRAVCNKAINQDIVKLEWYPFRKHRMRKEKTVPRVMTMEEIKSYFSLNLPPTHPSYTYWNIGRLIFMLRGINLRDLILLKPECLKNGRLIYRRAKTGKLYSIQVTPEITATLSTFTPNETLLGVLTGDRISGIKHFKTVAIKSFDYLCSILFQPEHFRVISNQTWYEPGKTSATEGEQPIDVAYTIIALSEFYVCFGNYDYLTRMTRAFEWYLGRNQLNQIVYNPISGGCLDGIEAKQVNINQGAEATTTYLMARNRMEKHQRQKDQEQTTQLTMNTHNNFKITTPYAQDRNFTRTKS
jgi:integrase/recombinase XerD